MREYLYIDENRIVTYHDQCSSPVAYDKVPMWKVSLGLTNAGVEGQQSCVPRQRTLHEKIEEVRKHLHEAGLLKIGRIDGGYRETNKAVFGHEVLNARRLRFRKTEPPLCLWYSDDEVPSEVERPGKAIFLIEDYRSDDHKHPDRFSGYSSLMLLYDALDKMPEGCRLITAQSRRSTSEAFEENPLQTLTSLDAEVGQPQKIEVFYRLRSNCMAQEDQFGTITTIAYPLAIWTA